MDFRLTPEQTGFAQALTDLMRRADSVKVARAWAAGDSAAGLALWQHRGTEASPSPSPSQTSDAFERPEDWSPHRPAVHITPEKNWMNYPQKPFLLDGVWHYYYLYNADYPDGNGTAWYHATSTDLVHWTDE